MIYVFTVGRLMSEVRIKLSDALIAATPYEVRMPAQSCDVKKLRAYDGAKERACNRKRNDM